MKILCAPFCKLASPYSPDSQYVQKPEKSIPSQLKLYPVYQPSSMTRLSSPSDHLVIYFTWMSAQKDQSHSRFLPGRLPVLKSRFPEHPSGSATAKDCKPRSPWFWRGSR